MATLPYTESELRSWRQFKSGARSSSFELQIAHVRATRRATDACQIGKERVLSAGLSVQIQKRQIATERPLKLWPIERPYQGDARGRAYGRFRHYLKYRVDIDFSE